MTSSFLLIVLPVFLGTVAMASMGIVRRRVMKGGELSTLQCLILWYGGATFVFATVYLYFWSFTIPEVMPGMWTAVLCGAAANSLIQFFNVKAASIDKGEVSLTAPLQAMTPGLITILALLLGEYPSTIGVAGIMLMAFGSYVLLLEKTPGSWYGYVGPIQRIGILLRAGSANTAERNKALVVTLALGSACMGTVGLLFDGLYTRRSLSLQGLMLASMALVAILCFVYTTWYLIRSDAKPTQRISAGLPHVTMYSMALMAILWVLHIVLIQPTFNDAFIAYVGTLKRFSVLISVVLGFLIFSEQNFKQRLWASVFIIGGALCIATDELPTRLATKLEGFGL